MRAVEEGCFARTSRKAKSWVWIAPIALFLAFCLITLLQVVRLPGGILTLLGCTCPSCPQQQPQIAGPATSGSQAPLAGTAAQITASKPALNQLPALVAANPAPPPVQTYSAVLPWWRLPHPHIDRIRRTTPTFPAASPAVQAAAMNCLRTTFITDKPLDMRVYSQWGEDGILEGIFKCIGTTDKKYVEFGTEDGQERSTRWLNVGHNFTGLLMDGGYENPEINLRKEFIFADTISQVLHKNGASFPIMDHMTIDIDMNTWHVTMAVMRGGWRPRSLMVEFNRNFLPHQSYIVEYIREKIWTAEDCYFGGSALAFDRVLAQFHYQLVAVDQYGVNLFYVHESALGWPKEQVHAHTDTKLHPLQQVWLHLHRGCAERTWIEVPEGKDVDFKHWNFNSGRKALLHQHEREDQIRVLYEAIPGDEAQRDVTYNRYLTGNHTIHYRSMVLKMGDSLVNPNNAGLRISTLPSTR